MKKVLVTGATGFIGIHVIKQLKELCTDCEIIACGRNAGKLSKIEKQFGIKTFAFDIGEKHNNWYTHLGEPDILIHLAWADLDNYKSETHFERQLFQHYTFLKNMIENGLTDLTVAGTCFEYGLVDGCVKEENSCQPVTAYGLAKATLYNFLQLLLKKYSLNFKWLRYFYMYGDGQSKRSLLPLLDEAIERGDRVFNMSNGEQLRDFLPVEKVAEYTVVIATQLNVVSGAINICSGKPISIRNLIEQHIIKQSAGIELNRGYYPYPEYEPIAFWGDNSKLTRVLQNR